MKNNIISEHFIWKKVELIHLLLFLSLKPGTWELSVYKKNKLIKKILIHNGKIFDTFLSLGKNVNNFFFEIQGELFEIKKLKINPNNNYGVSIEDLYINYLKQKDKQNI